MGLTMSQRQAVTKATAARYERASRVEKGAILHELCATTGWHRNHARKALRQALRPKVVRPRRLRAAVYGADVIVALRFCWAARRREAARAGDGRAGRGIAPLR